MSKKNKRKNKAAMPRNMTVDAPNSAAKGARKAQKANKKPLNRRNMLKALIALPVAGAVGAAIHRHDVQNRGLHDLSSIGQGQPVVVQIHDPACQLCRRLMKNTRAALKDNDEIVFKVADVTSTEGEAFRREHHGKTVSLVLFDARGNQRGTIEGVQSVEDLKAQFIQL